VQPMTTTVMLDNPTIRGAVYRQTHEATVQSVLLERAPRVTSRGTAFFNVDRWTLRIFTFHMCKWAHDNPGCVPTRTDVGEWVKAANDEHVSQREIVIANTPDRLPVRTAMALTGGAYHEAWHTLYSCRRSLTVDEMCQMVLPRWAKIPNWAAIHGLLQDWSNIVEDIRIERLGCAEFPGAPSKMLDLQDFILTQEAEGFQDARRHAVQAGKPPEAVKRGDLSIVTGAFRDKGLGYKTRMQQIAWEGYVKDKPDAVKMVTEGPLSPILDEAINLTRRDDTGCLRLALDALIVLVQHSGKQDQDQKDRDEAKDGQQGDGKQNCKACGAPAHKLVVRPKSDGKGGKVKGVGICTCTVCGHQEEVRVKLSTEPKNRDQQLKDAAQGPGPKWEGWDPEDFQGQQGGGQQDDGEKGEGQQSGQGSGKDQKQGGGKDQDGQGSGGSEEGDDGQGSGGSEEGDGESGDEDGDGQGKGEGGDEDGEPEPTPGEGDGEGWSDGYTDNPNFTGQESGDGKPNTSKQKGASMGQGDAADKPVEGNDYSGVAAAVVSAAEKGEKTGLKDNNQALGESVNEAVEKELGTVKEGEAAYRPYDTSHDEVVIVPPSRRGRAWDLQQARNLLDSVRNQTSYLRARMANIFRALEQVDVVHGTRFGDDLSEPFLVETAVDLRAGVRPSRAYYQTDEVLDTSMAAVIVLDESSSMLDQVVMEGRRTTLTEVAARIMIAITEPLDRLGIPVMATGFRNGRGQYGFGGRGHNEGALTPQEQVQHTRYWGHCTDVFKTFDERFQDVMWRFANTRGTGGTPMADGMQFGLDALNYRNEGHRVMFVVTDGCPSGGYDVIAWQLRIAKEAGIHIIGVGLGEPAKYVKDLFPDHVWSNDFNEFPILLLNKLNAMIDKTASKRGQRMSLGA